MRRVIRRAAMLPILRFDPGHQATVIRVEIIRDRRLDTDFEASIASAKAFPLVDITPALPRDRPMRIPHAFSRRRRRCLVQGGATRAVRRKP